MSQGVSVAGERRLGSNRLRGRGIILWAVYPGIRIDCRWDLDHCRWEFGSIADRKLGQLHVSGRARLTFGAGLRLVKRAFAQLLEPARLIKLFYWASQKMERIWQGMFRIFNALWLDWVRDGIPSA